MLIPSLALIAGLVALLWSADRFIDSASGMAALLGAPPIFIGIVVIGFGTSAPELMVSAMAALEGSPELALGNAFGSNTANIGLVLGIMACLYPVTSRSRVIRVELITLVLITLLAGGLLINGQLGRLDATILLLAFMVLLGISIRRSFADDDVLAETSVRPAASAGKIARTLALLVISLILLLLASRLLVWGAVEVARGLGVSELIIGLTVVALGTSLPELASGIAALRKGEHDLALGNILGSCLFNTLAVVGLAAAIAPFTVGPELLYRDWLIMFLLASLLLLHSLFQRNATFRVPRASGVFLIVVYFSYLIWLVTGAR